MRVICGCLGMLFVFVWSASAQTIEVPLKIQENASYPVSAKIKLLSTTPEGMWKLPNLTNKRVHYAQITLAGQKHLVLFVRQNTLDSPGSSDLIIDENGDGDLVNEHPTRLGNMVKLTVNGRSYPYAFNITNDNGLYLMINALYSFEGQFIFENQRYRIILNDTNADGRLTDTIEQEEIKPRGRAKLRDAYRGDVLLLSSENKNGSYFDHFILGKWIGIKKQLFAIQIDDATQKLILTPATNDLVTVILPYETDRIWLVSEDGRNSISYLSPGTSISIPKGKYRILEYVISKKDEQGDLWVGRGSATTNTPAFAAETTESVCPFGEPYTPKTEVIRMANANPQLQFYVLGTSQEVLYSIQHISGNQSKIAMTKNGFPKEPTYKIVKADGEVAAQGNFEYG